MATQQRRATTILAAMLSLAVLAAALVAFVTPSGDVAGGVARGAAGCEVQLPDDSTPMDERVESVVPGSTAPTAMDHARPGVNVRESLAEVQALLSRFAVVAEFTLPSTGMQVSVLSDGPLQVDPDAFDRLVRLPLTQPRMYGDAAIAEIQGCYARRLIDEREFAGRVLRVFVPASPSRCFRNGILVDAGHGDGNECDSAGVTLPQVELRPQLFGLEVGGAALPATVIVTAAVPRGHPDPDGRLARVLLHELHHVTENGMGLTPWAGSLRHYEQRAYYVERSVRRHLDRHGLALPRPIRFVPAENERS